MITLNSISKEVGKGSTKKLVLDDINWTIEPGSRTIVLGQPGCGKSTLLDIISGMAIPTKGWVERRATVSVPGGLLRFASYDTPRKLIMRMSLPYRANAEEVVHFLQESAHLGDIMDTAVSQLEGWQRTQLNMALTYAFPCDFYVFDGSIEAGRRSKFRDFCQRAFEARSRTSGIVAVTGSTKTARKLGKGAMGGLLHQTKLTIYRDLEDAITVFDNLPPPVEAPSRGQHRSIKEEERLPEEMDV